MDDVTLAFITTALLGCMFSMKNGTRTFITTRLLGCIHNYQTMVEDGTLTVIDY